MTLPALADVGQLLTRLGVDSLDGPDLGQAGALLAYASAVIRGYTGRTYLDDDGALVDPLPDGIAEVCVEMVFRAITNPAGVTQDTAGPFTVSFGSDAAQRIYLTASDKTILGGRASSGLWTQPVTRGPIETPSVSGAPFCPYEGWV